jgi:regulator of replication initiation timing
VPSKSKKQKAQDLQLEVKQLRAALLESQKYADKLVEHIPYLPADIKNLREANEFFSEENEKLKKLLSSYRSIDTVQNISKSDLDIIKLALEAAEQFTICDEFPGPYHVKSGMGLHDIYSKSGDIVAVTKYKDFASFIVNTLNAVDNHLKAIDN